MLLIENKVNDKINTVFRLAEFNAFVLQKLAGIHRLNYVMTDEAAFRTSLAGLRYIDMRNSTLRASLVIQ